MNSVPKKFSERELAARLRRMIYTNGRIRCPHCNRYRIQKLEHRYWCPVCRKKFSLTSHTWLTGMKVPLTIFFTLLDCWVHEVPVAEAHRRTKVSVPTVRLWYHRFRTNLVETVAFEPRESIQADEAYFGRFKRQANYLHGFRTYKVVTKVGVVGVACPQTGTLATRIIEGPPGECVRAFVREHVPTTVRVYADGSPLYTRLRATHNLVQRTHDQGFHFAYYIESCWSWMKRKLFKMYHHFTTRYAAEYVRELTWRYNTRTIPKDPLYFLARSFKGCSNCLS